MPRAEMHPRRKEKRKLAIVGVANSHVGKIQGWMSVTKSTDVLGKYCLPAVHTCLGVGRDDARRPDNQAVRVSAASGFVPQPDGEYLRSPWSVGVRVVAGWIDDRPR